MGSGIQQPEVLLPCSSIVHLPVPAMYSEAAFPFSDSMPCSQARKLAASSLPSEVKEKLPVSSTCVSKLADELQRRHFEIDMEWEIPFCCATA